MLILLNWWICLLVELHLEGSGRRLRIRLVYYKVTILKNINILKIEDPLRYVRPSIHGWSTGLFDFL